MHCPIASSSKRYCPHAQTRTHGPSAPSEPLKWWAEMSTGRLFQPVVAADADTAGGEVSIARYCSCR